MQALVALAIVVLALAGRHSSARRELTLFTALSCSRPRRWPIFLFSVSIHLLGTLLLFEIAMQLTPPAQDAWLERTLSSRLLVIQMPARVYTPADAAPSGPMAAEPSEAQAALPRIGAPAERAPAERAFTTTTPAVEAAPAAPLEAPAGLAAPGPGEAAPVYDAGFDPALANFQQVLLKAYLFMLSPKGWVSWQEPLLGEAGAVLRIVHPRNARFDVVVTHSSASESFPEGDGALSGGPIYTVYLQVGALKEWVLQYCVPNTATHRVRGNVVELANPTPVQAPYPLITYKPSVYLEPGVHYMLVHGFLDTMGRLRQLAVVWGGVSQIRELVLDSLEKWEFRPATTEAGPVRVEILLAIFPDRA